jgi:DTW domain-containing protein YfiP
MFSEDCFCALMPSIETKTRLLLVIHRAEERKTTNTGRLAAYSLVNSEVVVRGNEGAPSEPLPIPAGTQPILLYPADDAVYLDELAPSLGKVTLIVPDGNWRQASKVRKRVPGLLDVPCAKLPMMGPSRYRLRSEAHAHGLATIEAIARALGILEGPETRAALERPFDLMVERTLRLRGTPENATGPSPAENDGSAAAQHDEHQQRCQ